MSSRVVLRENHAEIVATRPDGSTWIALIDLEDAARCEPGQWGVYHVGGGLRYWRAVFDGRSVYLHRFILDAPSGMYVDHINHDLNDHRRENLRLVNPAQSAQNMRPARQSSTGEQNVVFSRHGRFRVRITVNGKMLNFGTYSTLAEARIVAQAKRAELQPFRHSSVGGAA